MLTVFESGSKFSALEKEIPKHWTSPGLPGGRRTRQPAGRGGTVEFSCNVNGGEISTIFRKHDLRGLPKVAPPVQPFVALGAENRRSTSRKASAAELEKLSLIPQRERADVIGESER